LKKDKEITSSSNQKNRWRKYKISLLVILVAISVAAIYGYSEYNRGMLDTHQLKPIFKINAQELLKQFETNESGATSRYTDKTISVGGIVSYTNVTDTSASIYLNDASSVASVICVFQKDSYKESNKLKTGDSVTIKGICSGYLMDVIMVRCVLDD
jgi:hypothetical protein